MILSNSHQPFLFKHNNQMHLIYCEKNNTLIINQMPIIIWSIFVLNLETNTKKRIFNIENRIECNPSVRYENNSIILNYIASNIIEEKIESIDYFLYRTILDNDFNIIREEQQLIKTFSGFETLTDIYYFSLRGGYEYINIQNKDTNNENILNISSITNGLARIIPIFNSNNFIVTDPYTQRSFYIQDNFTNDPPQIKNNQHQSIYKCSILDNTISYAVKKQDLENRDIIIEEGYYIE